MNFTSFNAIKPVAIIPGHRIRSYHTEGLTLSQWTVEMDKHITEHSHHYFQLITVITGEIQFVVDGESRVLAAGDIVGIPEGALHSGLSITECRLLVLCKADHESCI